MEHVLWPTPAHVQPINIMEITVQHQYAHRVVCMEAARVLVNVSVRVVTGKVMTVTHPYAHQPVKMVEHVVVLESVIVLVLVVGQVIDVKRQHARRLV